MSLIIRAFVDIFTSKKTLLLLVVFFYLAQASFYKNHGHVQAQFLEQEEDIIDLLGEDDDDLSVIEVDDVLPLEEPVFSDSQPQIEGLDSVPVASDVGDPVLFDESEQGAVGDEIIVPGEVDDFVDRAGALGDQIEVDGIFVPSGDGFDEVPSKTKPRKRVGQPRQKPREASKAVAGGKKPAKSPSKDSSDAGLQEVKEVAKPQEKAQPPKKKTARQLSRSQQRQMQRLRRHLVKFVTRFDQEVASSKVRKTTKEAVDIDELIGIDDGDRPAGSPSVRYYPQITAESNILTIINVLNPDISSEQVYKNAGTCLHLPGNLEACQQFTCIMPQEPGSKVFVEHMVKGRGEESLCLYDYKKVAGPQNETSCKLPEGSRMILAQSILESFAQAKDTSERLREKYHEVLRSDCVVDKKLISKKIEQKAQQRDAANVSQKIEEIPSKEQEVPVEVVDDVEDKVKQVQQPVTKKLKEEKEISALPEQDDEGLSTREKRALEKVADRITKDRVDDNAKNANDISIDRSSKASPNISVKVRERGGQAVDKELEGYVSLNQAYRALVVGQTEAAISIYKVLLEQNHENTDAMFGLAAAYQRNNQALQAKKIYVELLEIQPDNTEALNNFLVLVAQDTPKVALLELRKLERLNPGFSPIAAQIAMIHLRQGDLQKAERNLRRALLLDPKNIVYVYNMAIILDKLGKSKQAADYYGQVITLNRSGQSAPGSIGAIEQRLQYLKKLR